MREVGRTKHSKVFDTGRTKDGKPIYQQIIQKNMHYRDQDGRWVDYDGTIEHDSTPDDKGNTYHWRVKKADYNLRMFINKNKRVMRIGFGKGVFVDYVQEIVNNPVVTGNVCYVTDAKPNTDLRIIATPEGVKEDIILKAPGHPAQFVVPIELSGCTAQVEGQELVYYKDSEVIGRIPAPYMIDANGNIGEVTLTYDGQSVIFTPNAAWLEQPERAWPITVDPTTVLQPDATGKDTYVYASQASTNYGTATNLTTRSGGGITYRSLIEFAFSAAIPPNKNITSAVLDLWCYNTNGSFTFAAHKVTGTWGETTATWNTQPTFDPTPTAQFQTNNIYDVWIPINITDVFREWYNGSSPNYGLLLKAPDEGATTYAVYRSSDYATTPSQRPKLTVEYEDTGYTYYLQVDGVDDRITAPSMTYDEIVVDFAPTPASWKPYVSVGTSGAGSELILRNGSGVDVIGSRFTAVYVNGVQVTSNTAFITSGQRVTMRALLTPATNTLNVYWNGVGVFMSGNINNIKLYNAGVLQAHYDLAQGNVYDQSGNGRHATLVGGTWVVDAQEPPPGTAVTVLCDTLRRVSKGVQTNADTIRPVAVSTTVNSDTSRTVVKSVTAMSDTVRKVIRSVGFNADTKRRVVRSVTVGVDTLRKAVRSAVLRADTKRRVSVSVTATADTMRRVSVTVQGYFDTLRRVIAGWLIKDTTKYTWRELPSQYAFTELPEQYRFTERKSGYTWEELRCK